MLNSIEFNIVKLILQEILLLIQYFVFDLSFEYLSQQQCV